MLMYAGNAKPGYVLFVLFGAEGFREVIGYHLVCRYVRDFQVPTFNPFSNKVVGYVDVFGSSHMLWVFCQSYCAVVVA